MQAGPLVSSTLSPSFNSYSSSGTENLADIAARVVNEFRRENGSNDDVFGFDEYVHEPGWDVIDKDHYDYDDDNQSRSLFLKDQDQDQDKDHDDQDEDEDEDEDEESEFEFAFVSAEPDSSPISADEIFHNGLIKPVYPLFDRTLLLEAPSNDAATKEESDKTTRRTRQPLRKLMVEEERETTATAASSSCDSSESDELEGLTQGSFCVWKPKNGAVSGGGGDDGRRGRGKKSGSTGSSKRWKLRDILSRSGSVGKDGFVFVAPIKKLGGSKRAGKVEAVAEKEKNDVVLSSNNDDERGGGGGGGGDMLKGRNKDNTTTTTTEDKKRSFLPYKQDFVGFLANVNGLSRNLHPF
ncbi:hypothetical protein TorRG33x02_335610 [Trema orientale]|uniref:Uncharacterized protein n=1 Tax=Trema orientale TaxID=63057 RepID=A0A2P5B181_TREOI|nr:hypothetical protein TorRG33x02_335610 [Trema orientale]